MEQSETGFELRISVKSLAVVAVGAIVLLGGRTLYSAVEAQQSWIWILVQVCVLVFGLLVSMVVAGVKGEKNE